MSRRKFICGNWKMHKTAGEAVQLVRELRQKLDGAGAQLSVVDEGMGIPEDDHDRVFEKFYRGADTASAIGGTGLGLAVAREIVTSHGGEIGVESEASQGSTFTVRLPIEV